MSQASPKPKQQMHLNHVILTILLAMDHLYPNLSDNGSEPLKLQDLVSTAGPTKNNLRLKLLESVLQDKKKFEKEYFFHKKINKI